MIHNFNQWKLNESLASARARFLKPGLVDQGTFDQLKALDPTPTFKYLDKIIEFYLSGVATEEIATVISRFHTLLNKNQVKTRDINSFKTFDQLRFETQSSETQYASKQKTKARSKDYDLVYEDNKWLVVIPRTHEASCKYGAGTKWCTSAKKTKYYKEYTRKGITLYYIISKELQMDDPFHKMAVAVNPNGEEMECFDSKDKSITLKKILDITGLNKSLFVPNPNKLTPYEQLGLYKSKITQNPDGSIDYDGDVDVRDLELKIIPVNFRKVSGNFDCSRNQLTSLEGAPREVGGNFDCSRNQLTSLEGAPREVGGDFDCGGNKLTSLEGAPSEVRGDFVCGFNQLTSLEGAPTEVGGNFNCWGNQLTSLKGAPKEVEGNFDCSRNQLTSLEGAPKEVEGDFDCSRNQLTSLEGAPKEVGGDFDCGDNQLTSLEGAPKEVEGDFDCSRNQLTSLEGAPKVVGGSFWCTFNPGLPGSEKQWARENIKAKNFYF